MSASKRAGTATTIPNCPVASRRDTGLMSPCRFMGGISRGDLVTLRPPHHWLVLLGRYSWTNLEGTALLTQAPGWQWTVVRIMGRYWLDVPGRLRRRRNRFLTIGSALIGRLRYSLNDRKVPVWLQSPLVELIVERSRARRRRRAQRTPRAHRGARGVVMGAGGFEHNREMRERYLPSPDLGGLERMVTGNTGDAIRARRGGRAAPSR